MPGEIPTTLLAELTHRCPLHCPYCSNPLDLIRAESELATEDWKRVFTQARALGVLQLGLSGGESERRRNAGAEVEPRRSGGRVMRQLAAQAVVQDSDVDPSHGWSGANSLEPISYIDT